ncbi:MAG: choice-of-anchor E domain-containing protein [Candidatus Eisenbacteria bacterium]|nr:choice-of-anchor E domain-containing protein [Candidatus Eisenbacteria bacterium]
MKRLLLLPMVVGALALAGSASANIATVQYDDTVNLASTNWNDTVSFPQFDPNLGTLLSVTFELGGHVEGSAKFESLDNAPATVTMNLAAEIDLQRPDLSSLVTVLPLAATNDNVLAFDGVIDFLGDSGRTYEDLSGDDMESSVTTDSNDLTLFTGNGTIDLPVSAMGASNGSGAGNLILQFATSASASVTVIYEYEEPIVPTHESTWGRIKSSYR